MKSICVSFTGCGLAWFISHTDQITDVAQAIAACISVLAGAVGLYLVLKRAAK